jgi:hypothetical protein
MCIKKMLENKTLEQSFGRAGRREQAIGTYPEIWREVEP